MKLQDIDSKLVLKPEMMAAECHYKIPYHLHNEQFYKDCEVRWWSGFYDKNGVKIYDGDIVKHVDMQDLCCITLYAKTGSCVFYICNAKIPKELHYSFGDNLHSLYSENGYKGSKIECIEIVGNIHENADLLKTKE